MARRVPSIFYFVFGLREQTEPFHLVHYLCLESCRRVNRPERMVFCYHHEPFGRYWEAVRDRLELVRVAPVDLVRNFYYSDRAIARFRYAHESDFVRLEKLLETGGVYADIDTIFLSPIPERLFHMPFVLGREDDLVDRATGERQRSLCNALIMAEANADFGRVWQAEMRAAFDGTWSNHSTVLPQRLSERHPDLIHVEPRRTFYRHMWTKEGITTLLEGCDPDFSGMASLHLWSHLWWSRNRRDFSKFHAGRLTEEFIRRRDTTYTLAARPFLPEATSDEERGNRATKPWQLRRGKAS